MNHTYRPGIQNIADLRDAIIAGLTNDRIMELKPAGFDPVEFEKTLKIERAKIESELGRTLYE